MGIVSNVVPGAGSVADNGVTNAKLRDSAAMSVIGRSANSVGDPADITTSADGEVLRRSGTTLGFGTIATAGIADDAVTYAKVQNVSATDKLLGRVSSGAGNIEEIAFGHAHDAAIGSTITWDGTPPSSATGIRYSYQQIGYMVFLTIRLEYSGAGTTNTTVAVELPTGVPTPIEPTGSADTEILYAGHGQGYTSNMTGNGSAAKCGLFKQTGVTNGYTVELKGMTSGSMVGAVMSVMYPTASAT